MRDKMHQAVDMELTLAQVYLMTNFTDAEFDDIANMQIGEERSFDANIFLERTQ